MKNKSNDSGLEKLIELASRGTATVLITGPTGSGKTVLARKIHEKSARRNKPFVTINLAALHEGTFESELFGHERGAFTGADQRRMGKLELAQGGTVFLDEVGELPLRLQARLLEFLQSRFISPMGGNREIRLDVRVIAATNKNLNRTVSQGQFREDLFHRLRVIAIPLKSLNERWNEFDELVHSTLSEVCRSEGKTILRISESVASRLEAHRWPGNLRELRNVVEYMVQAADGPEIEVSHLPAWLDESSSDLLACADSRLDSDFTREWTEVSAGMSYGAALAQFEKIFLGSSLKKNGGRISATARQVGMNKTTLLRRVKVYGLAGNSAVC